MYHYYVWDVLMREGRTDEAARLPAIMANASFAAKPWETIRLHTLNTLETLKAPARPKSNKNAQKKLK